MKKERITKKDIEALSDAEGFIMCNIDGADNECRKYYNEVRKRLDKLARILSRLNDK